jgi:hypothetical protein
MTEITQHRAHGMSDNLKAPLRGWRWLMGDEHRDRDTRPEKGKKLHRCEFSVPNIRPSR